MSAMLFTYIKSSFEHFRYFVTTSAVASNDVPLKPDKPPINSSYSGDGLRKMTPQLSNFHKRILVFAKRYKSFSEVPNSVPVEVLERARSKARIRLSNYLMFLTGFGCLLYAYSGRKAAERGESVVKSNRDWHKEYVQRLDEQEKAAQKSLRV